jgi:phosphonate degradation associated HDIG domain protein
MDQQNSGLSTLTPNIIVAHLSDIFDRCGGEEYLGEPVTMAQHMLQGASLADHQGHSKEVIAAALLHDIGHFTSEFGTFSMADTHDRQHEVFGAKVLAPFFPEKVTQCVRYHVAAKRYLCATRAEYFSQLSAASVHSLQLQGGPMNAEEVAQFETNPHLQDIIQVRLLDDGGKVADMQTHNFAYFQNMLQELVNEHCI